MSDPREEGSARPDTGTLGGMLLEQVALHPSRHAFVSQTETWTYEQLGTRTLLLARGLAAAGVSKGTRVGLLMPTRADWLATAFAIALNGGVLVPISTFASPAERHQIMRMSSVTLLLSSDRSGPRDISAELIDSYPSITTARPGQVTEPSLPYLRRVFVFGDDIVRGGLEAGKDLATLLAETFPGEAMSARARDVTPFDDAVIYFTSGSTAAPKAVLHAHRGPVTSMRQMAKIQRLDENEVMFGGKAFFWVGMTSTVGACLAAGACYVGLERFAVDAALTLMERERVTVVNCSPRQLDLLGKEAESGAYDLSCLRLVQPSRLSRAAGLGPDDDYLVGYGMTETAGTICSLPCDAPLEERESNGRPLEGVVIRIVDAETGAEQPVGVPGVVHIKGPGVMRGYLGRPPEAALSDGFLVTQDLGFLDENGLFHFTGRTSGLIKTAGANVAREEVEAAVRAWGALDQAYVVGLPHATLGEAVVVVAVGDEATFSHDALETHLRTQLASYKLPKAVVFMSGEAIPRTAVSDKVDYVRLAEEARELVLAQTPGADWA